MVRTVVTFVYVLRHRLNGGPMTGSFYPLALSNLTPHANSYRIICFTV